MVASWWRYSGVVVASWWRRGGVMVASWWRWYMYLSPFFSTDLLKYIIVFWKHEYQHCSTEFEGKDFGQKTKSFE